MELDIAVFMLKTTLEMDVGNHNLPFFLLSVPFTPFS